MSDDSAMDTDTQQSVVSEERMDLLWKLLHCRESKEHQHLMEMLGVGATITVGSKPWFRLHQPDLDALIKYRGLTWQSIERYVSWWDRLMVGPFVLTGYRITDGEDLYIVNFDYFSLCMVEELRQADEFHHHKTALQTLTKLYASLGKDPAKISSLRRQTKYGCPLQKCSIKIGLANLGGGSAVDDPDFVKWVVENVSTLTISPTNFPNQAWAVFCETITGAASKVKVLEIATDSDQAPSSLSPGLAETIEKASTVETLKIQVSESGEELQPFLDETFKNDHILHLEVTGELDSSDWLYSLSAIIEIDQFPSIEYGVFLYQASLHDKDSLDYDEDERENLTKLIRQAKSLTYLQLNAGVTFQHEFRKHIFEPIFKERRFQNRALDIAPKLESNNDCAGLLGRLISHGCARSHPNVLFDIIRVNTAPLGDLWNGGRVNRIALLKQRKKIIVRELEAAEASMM